MLYQQGNEAWKVGTEGASSVATKAKIATEIRSGTRSSILLLALLAGGDLISAAPEVAAPAAPGQKGFPCSVSRITGSPVAIRSGHLIGSA